MNLSHSANIILIFPTKALLQQISFVYAYWMHLNRCIFDSYRQYYFLLSVTTALLERFFTTAIINNKQCQAALHDYFFVAPNLSPGCNCITFKES